MPYYTMCVWWGRGSKSPKNPKTREFLFLSNFFLSWYFSRRSCNSQRHTSSSSVNTGQNFLLFQTYQLFHSVFVMMKAIIQRKKSFEIGLLWVYLISESYIMFDLYKKVLKKLTNKFPEAYFDLYKSHFFYLKGTGAKILISSFDVFCKSKARILERGL